MENQNEAKPNGTSNKVLADLAVRIALGILMLWAAYITNVIAAGQDFDFRIGNRTTLLEETTVSHSELYEFERNIDQKFDEAINEIKECLNKIQQDRLCD